MEENIAAKSLKDFVLAMAFKMQKTTPRTPQENGIAKRMNITIMERARSMRLHANFSLGFWAKAISTIVYLINTSP